MKKLKIILQSKWLYYILIIFTLLYSIINFKKPTSSKLNENTSSFTGIITNIKINGNLLTLELNGIEKIIASYYFESEEDKNNFQNIYQLGDKIYIEGTFYRPSSNTIFNLFNYRKYLERKKIFYQASISSIKKISNNKNLFYKIKNSIQNKINNYDSKEYLNAFILGDTNSLGTLIKTNYQELGVSHLLAISGMHISLFSSIILWLLRKLHIKEIMCYFVTILFLIFYMKITGSTPSVSRAVILFILLTLNKLLSIKLSTLKIWCFTFMIVVLKNPYNLLEIGFQFSFLVSFYLILLSKKLKSKNYFVGLLKVSTISLLVSIPISIYYFYQINILSIIWNLIFVPFVSLIVFPFSLITFIFPFFDSILYLLINILEKIASLCNNFEVFKLIFGKPSMIWILFYYLFITIYLYKGKKLGLVFSVLLLIFQYFNLLLISQTFLIAIDVGQGDALLIHSKNTTVLIDTGGKISYNREKWQEGNTKSLSDNTIIPLIKSLGIKKVDYLIISHGDYDHMGEAINVVNKLRVGKVILNCGESNDLEQNLIKVLNKKNISYYSCIKNLNIGDNKLYFLNDELYDNENDNSLVIYTKFNNYKFLFMGDSGISVEEDLIKKYNLNDIDVLKVGHHGSKTSSGKKFIDVVNPKYSIISVGKNNRYGHPNNSVLENLKRSKVYRTDVNGSIMFVIKNNKLMIETCEP